MEEMEYRNAILSVIFCNGKDIVNFYYIRKFHDFYYDQYFDRIVLGGYTSYRGSVKDSLKMRVTKIWDARYVDKCEKEGFILRIGAKISRIIIRSLY